jgi:hypothetical protein
MKADLLPLIGVILKVKNTLLPLAKSILPLPVAIEDAG